MQNLNKLWQSPRLRYALIAGILIAVLLLLLWRGGFFMVARLGLNDLYYAPQSTTGSIVIIALDDESLNRYGSTPAEWPRTVYTTLAEQLAATNARVVAFDLLFSETETEDEALAAALAALRQNSARTRIVLADAGINGLTATGSDGFLALPFADELPLSVAIEAVADYRGFTNTLPDVDAVVRRQPSLIRVNENRYFAFSIATYLAYLRIPSAAAEQVITQDENTLWVTSERRIPVDAYGMWQQNYFGPPTSEAAMTFPIVSLADVVDGKVEASFFDDKIVLVGLINNTGMLDQYRAPSTTNGGLMAGIEIQANAIESLLQSTFLAPVGAGWQAGIIVFLAIAASLIYALPRWYFKIGLAAVLLLGWFILASLMFSISYQFISLFDTLLALALPLAASIGIDITLETFQRQQKEFLLDSLQRLAEQRLQLEQAANYILDDVERIAPGIAATLFIKDGQQADACQRYKHGEKVASGPAVKEDPLLKRYRSATATLRDQGVTVFPLLWQGKQQGILVLEHPQQTHLNRSTEQILSELVEQLAPNIDNMLLYEEVQRQKTLLDSVFAESPTGIAVVDHEGRIMQSNQEMAALFDLPQDAINNKLLPDLFKAKIKDSALVTKLREGIEGTEPFHIDEVALGGKAVRIDSAPLQEYKLWIVIIGDITVLVNLSKLKTQMLRIASHDLKNPLARISGFAELLQMQAQLEEQQKRYLSFIVSASEEMLHIIDDILNLERLRSGKVVHQDINFTQLVREVCASHQPDLIHKQQQFEVNLPDKLVHVHGDTTQISQAVSNLVGNAIKYTPDGGHIIMRLLEQDSELRFEVEDSGYGIPKEAQARIFTEFYRAKTESTAHIRGTGLGLSLVKSVIEAHGGEIGFTSTEGEGSTFYFTLPGIAPDATE